MSGVAHAFHERSSAFQRSERNGQIEYQNMLMLQKLVDIKRGKRPSDTGLATLGFLDKLNNANASPKV